MEDQKKSPDNVEFEKGLRTLLQRSYHPVDSCPEFKKDLLTKLKTKQKEVSSRHIRRRKVRFAAFSFASSIAASVAIIIGIAFSTDLSPENNAAPVEIATGKARTADSTITAVNHSSSKLNNIEGVINISETNDAIDLTTSDHQGGVELAPGVQLVMDKASHVSIKNGLLDIDNGLLSLKVKENAKPYELKLKNHTIKIEPGSWLAMDVKDENRYAPGGAPAPDITLFSGSAIVANKNGSSVLSPKRTYRLHLYQSLEDMEGDDIGENYSDDSSLVEPILVNFKVLRK